MLETILTTVKKYIPRSLFKALQPFYHRALALLAALWYRFPSKKLLVIGVTGTKGKTTVVELISTILKESGVRVAFTNTYRFSINGKESRNLYKMSMPGRFFMQRFLHNSLKAGCTAVVIEMTSEGAKNFRHSWIDMDALVFTNLSPEHIESHGSFEKYRDAKLSLAHSLSRSRKPRRFLVINADDGAAPYFKATQNVSLLEYSLKNVSLDVLGDEGVQFTFMNEAFSSELVGTFNVYNIVAAATVCSALGISTEDILKAVKAFHGIRGRVEKIDVGQAFGVIVDYAHTPDSLEKLYEVFPKTRKVCVLGNAGGGRDTWKRKVMAEIADAYCDHIFLTDEDPYDENPQEIVDAMARYISKTPFTIDLDRRKAIRASFSVAHEMLLHEQDVPVQVLITGKGTDPFICGPNNTKIPWDDATVAKEELTDFL